MSNGLNEFINEVPSSNEKVEDKRDSFNDEELVKLFNNDLYEKGIYTETRGEFHDAPSRYWLPLIALFTGMRGNEIAQLYNDDIRYDEEAKFWFIDIRINEERKQSKKTVNAPRQVPIHPKLEELGLVRFANMIDGERMLFPECYSPNTKHYKAWGNNFNKKNKYGWKWQMGVTRDKAVFHSFRHNFTGALERKDVNEKVICALLGQKYKGELVPNYRSKQEGTILYEAVKLAEYPCIDWSKINARW